MSLSKEDAADHQNPHPSLKRGLFVGSVLHLALVVLKLIGLDDGVIGMVSPWGVRTSRGGPTVPPVDAERQMRQIQKVESDTSILVILIFP
jgi:hypothetical protein